MKSFQIFLFFLSLPLYCYSLSPEKQTQWLFRRLTGVPLTLTDTRYSEFLKLVKKNKLADATQLMVDDKNFYNIVLFDWASQMGYQDIEGNPLSEPTDFQALVIGNARDNLNAQQLLYGSYHYVDGTKVPQTAVPADKTAGLMTTHAWFASAIKAGTNRRAVKFAFNSFLCSDIETWKNASLPDKYVRRDVDRSPSGKPEDYQMKCRACHAPMDSFSGVFAPFDFVENKHFVASSPSEYPVKINQYNKNTKAPPGNIVEDETWVNLLADNPTFGWRGGENSGYGIKAFGKMLSKSQAFSSCMARRVVNKVCKNKDAILDPQLKASNVNLDLVDKAAEHFESSEYKLKSLFAFVAAQPECSEGPLVFKNAKEILETYSTVFDIKPSDETLEFFKNVKGQFPKKGYAEEFSKEAHLAAVKLSGYFCDPFISKNSEYRSKDLEALIQKFAKLIWQRSASEAEVKALTRTAAKLSTTVDAKHASLALCVAMASSPAILSQ